MNLEIARLFLQLERMVSIYSKNPISNILSASSITKCSSVVNLNFSDSWASFKGVEINISQDLTNS